MTPAQMVKAEARRGRRLTREEAAAILAAEANPVVTSRSDKARHRADLLAVIEAHLLIAPLYLYSGYRIEPGCRLVRLRDDMSSETVASGSFRECLDAAKKAGAV